MLDEEDMSLLGEMSEEDVASLATISPANEQRALALMRSLAETSLEALEADSGATEAVDLYAKRAFGDFY